MPDPLVSVIIPTYNRAKFIGGSIESVLHQTYQNFEIIIVDDGSTDKTEEVVRAFGDKRIRYYYNENSGSPVIPRNRGVRKSLGEYIAFLDSDDLWLSQKLEKYVQVINKHPDVPLVYSDCYLIDKKGEILNRYSRLSRPYQGQVFKRLLRKNFIATSTVVLKKVQGMDYGLMDQRYKISHDLDLYLKIAGEYEIKYINIPLAKLRFHEESVISNKPLMRQETRSIINKWRYSPECNIGEWYFRKILSYYYCMEAFDNLNRDEIASAQVNFREAFKHHPLNLFYLLLYLLSLKNYPSIKAGFNRLNQYRLYKDKRPL